MRLVLFITLSFASASFAGGNEENIPLSLSCKRAIAAKFSPDGSVAIAVELSQASAYDPANGELRWKVDLNGHPAEFHEAIQFVDHDQVAIGLEFEVVGLDLKTGEVLWTAKTGDFRDFSVIKSNGEIRIMIRKVSTGALALFRVTVPN